MSAHHCSFCKTFSSQVSMARICPSCAKGRVDDNRCDFCTGFGKADFARICNSCET